MWFHARKSPDYVIVAVAKQRVTTPWALLHDKQHQSGETTRCCLSCGEKKSHVKLWGFGALDTNRKDFKTEQHIIHFQSAAFPRAGLVYEWFLFNGLINLFHPCSQRSRLQAAFQAPSEARWCSHLKRALIHPVQENTKPFFYFRQQRWHKSLCQPWISRDVFLDLAQQHPSWIFRELAGWDDRWASRKAPSVRNKAVWLHLRSLMMQVKWGTRGGI